MFRGNPEVQESHCERPDLSQLFSNQNSMSEYIVHPSQDTRAVRARSSSISSLGDSIRLEMSFYCKSSDVFRIEVATHLYSSHLRLRIGMGHQPPQRRTYQNRDRAGHSRSHLLQPTSVLKLSSLVTRRRCLRNSFLPYFFESISNPE